MSSDGPVFYPTVGYQDARAAIEWLERAFGFARLEVAEGDGGEIVHAELSFGEGVMMLGQAPSQAHLESRPRFNAPYVYVADVDGHCDRARAAGAEVTREPEDKDYGGRGYSVRDLEGNEWSFGSYRPRAGA